MKKLLLVLCLGYFPMVSFSQTALKELDINNVGAFITNRASLFNAGTTNKYQIPRVTSGAPKHTIYAASPWIGGLSNGQLHLAAETYRQVGKDIHQGPVVSSYSAQHLAAWDRIWKINKTTLDAFITKVNNSEDVSGIEYTDIKEWPARGNVFGGNTTTDYAPFFDSNNNSIYEPLLGDYPLIKGDQCLFTILNDDTVHSETNGKALKVEIHRMVYAFATNNILNNTVFVDYKIINKSSLTYDSLIFSSWVDFDLGFYGDDYVGTDSVHNMVYAFNGDANDEGAMGYGTTPPAQACVMLNQPMATTMYYNNTNAPVTGNIVTATDAYNYMKGLWRNGASKTASDSGYLTNGAPTNYFYGGNPCTNTGWWEGSAGVTPGDRRILMSMAPQTLTPNQEIDVTLGFVYVRAVSGDNIASVCALQQGVDSVQNWFMNTPTTGMKKMSPKLQFSIYPSPAKDLAYIIGVKNKRLSISISDITGKVLKTDIVENGQPLNISALKQGLYFITIAADGQTATKRLVVE